MVKRIAVLLFLAGALPVRPVSAGGGTDAVPFMKVDTGARAGAMGGAFAAVADDASAIFHNPAGMAGASRKELMFSHMEWLEGIRNECLSYIHPAGLDWTFGAGASMLFSGSMTKRDRNGVDTGNFTENEGFVSLGAALALGDNFSGGAAFKSVRQKADNENAAAFAADAGLLYSGPEWRFALAMENLGSRLKLYHTSFSLPLAYKAAAAYRANHFAWLTAQLTHRAAGGIGVSAGAEYEVAVTERDSVFARAGYKSGGDADSGSGITFGLGVGNPDLKFDYAFTPFGDVGNVHRISLSAKFGETRDAARKGWAKGRRESYKRQQEYKAKPRPGQVKKTGAESKPFIW
ncbi:MAG: PorV/PorQ family protein [Elusimicrobiota bacterium]|nr:PorV/PorQ family protein [Elusimicrobiota bacterium]